MANRLLWALVAMIACGVCACRSSASIASSRPVEMAAPTFQGVGLSADGRIVLDGSLVGDPLVAASGLHRPARSLIVHALPDRRWAIVQVCADPSAGGCLSCYVTDRWRSTITPLTPHYFCRIVGSVSWSAMSRKAAFVSELAPAASVVIVDVTNGRTCLAPKPQRDRAASMPTDCTIPGPRSDD